MDDQENKQPDLQVIELKDTHCDHYFYIDHTDVKCKRCPNGWPGLAKYVTILDGKMTAYLSH